MAAARLKHASAVIAGFAALAVVMTWPLATVLGTAAPGVGEDTPLFLWNIWWVQQALLHHAGPLLWTDRLFAPEGTSLALHGLTLLPSVLVLPVSIVWSPVAALGVMALINCTLNSATTYRLVNRLTGSHIAGVVAGIAFAYSPWAVGELQNHYNLSTLWPFVLMLDALSQICERPDRRRALELGVAVALAAYTDLQFLVLAVPVGIVALVPAYLKWRKWGARSSLVSALALGGVVAAALTAPFAVAVAHDLAQAGPGDAGLTMSMHSFYSADLARIFVPDQLRAGGVPVPEAPGELAPARSASQFTQLGYVTLALALVAVRGRPGMWLALFAVALVLTLGPVVHVGGQVLTIGGVPALSPPGLLAAATPLLNIERVPTRHMVSASIALAVLAGFGIRRLSSGFAGWRRGLVLVVATGALMGELCPAPLPLQDLRQHPYYSTLAMTADKGAVLEVPFGRGSAMGGMGTYTAILLAEAAQTVHGHPIVNGYVSRGPTSDGDMLGHDAFFQYLGDCRELPPSAVVAREALENTGTRWVLVHTDWPSGGPNVCTPAPRDVAGYLEQVGLSRVYADDKLTVYGVPV